MSDRLDRSDGKQVHKATAAINCSNSGDIQPKVTIRLPVRYLTMATTVSGPVVQVRPATTIPCKSTIERSLLIMTDRSTMQVQVMQVCVVEATKRRRARLAVRRTRLGRSRRKRRRSEGYEFKGIENTDFSADADNRTVMMRLTRTKMKNPARTSVGHRRSDME